jgi:hypothetical protein
MDSVISTLSWLVLTAPAAYLVLDVARVVVRGRRVLREAENYWRRRERLTVIDGGLPCWRKRP